VVLLLGDGAAGVPYLVNVITDQEAVYPRSTTGV
jgi:hypothetical protein